MNRQFLGMLAVTLTTAFVQTSSGQGQAYPPPGPYPAYAAYPTQPAVYMNINPSASGVYPATMAAMPPGSVQPASCPSCGPTPVYGGEYSGPYAGAGDYVGYGGEGGMVYGQGVAGEPCDGGCDAAGCDGDGGPGGLLGGRGLFGGCGLFRGGAWGAGDPCGDGSCYGGGEGCGAGGGLDGLCFGGYNGCCGKLHGPCGSGGCCLPRWFDVHAEWLFWKRDYDSSLPFSSAGILGPEALNANQLDFSEESGYRITGAYMLGVSSAVEFTYFGGLNWASGANAASSAGELFSVFSDFGSNPLNGFPETDFAYLHEIGLSSELDNGEINFRHRWVSANCVFHNSILVGARYFRLREDLLYNTYTDLGAMNYKVKTDNDLVGAQLGGDMYLCVTPRLKIGAEVEGGVYGTSSSQRTSMISTNSPELREYDRENDVAFLGEAGVMALFRATSHLTLRVGYQVLYIDGVALAMDNFNTASPFTARDSFLDNDGDVFYHGATLGFEWTH